MIWLFKNARFISCLEVTQFKVGNDLQLYDCFFANIAEWETKKYTGHCCLKTQWISVGRSYSEQINPKYLWWFSSIRSNSLMNNIILWKEAAGIAFPMDQYVAGSWKVKTKASWFFFFSDRSESISRCIFLSASISQYHTPSSSSCHLEEITISPTD